MVVRLYLVSDVTHVRFEEVKFGWGKTAYGEPAMGGVGAIPGVTIFYIPFKNSEGEDGIIMLIYLSTAAMERFVKELDYILKKNQIVERNLLLLLLTCDPNLLSKWMRVIK